MSFSSCFHALMASRVIKTMPRPVASSRPSEPPIATGLPVTTAGTVRPLPIEYVSIIHAIVCALVPMSGAGMSMSGPMKMEIRREASGQPFQLAQLTGRGGQQTTPPFAPPNGMS